MRLAALGYSGFSQLVALITADVNTGAAGGAGGAGGGLICTGKGEGGAMGCGAFETAAIALTGVGAAT